MRYQGLIISYFFFSLLDTKASPYRWNFESHLVFPQIPLIKEDFSETLYKGKKYKSKIRPSPPLPYLLYFSSWHLLTQTWKRKWKPRATLWPHGYSPWNSPGQNIGVCSLSFLHGIFPTRGLNPGLPHCRQILYQLSHKGSPWILEWVAYPFSSRSSWPRNWTGVFCIEGKFFTNWAIREALPQTYHMFIWISGLLPTYSS